MNKITKFLQSHSDNPNKVVTNAMLLNTIREMASDAYKNDIPELPNMRPINHVNIPYDQYTVHQNEFFDILINRIGSTVCKALTFDNPLGIFRTENFEYGETLQEIYVGLAEKEAFNAKQTNSPFRFADTPIQTWYHDLNEERMYRRTIEKAWVMKAFVSDKGFDDFIDKMFISLMASDEVDEYEAIKNVLTRALSEITLADTTTITVPSLEIDTTQNDWLLTFNKELITRTNLFSVPSRSRFENAAGVPNATKIEDQFLIVSADLSAEIDSMLANAFNMNKATVLAKKIVIDEFPTFTGTGQHNGATPIACLISKNSLILKDKLFQMTNIWNPETLSYNYFLHHHQMVSFSLLENCRFYYTTA